MHPVRRRKKRPNYGVRSVEVKRGQNGFGFTISGQHPCILSCIVGGSPAETAGLRAGDYLVAVEGRSVSKVPHDEVVRLINCSTGVLKLQIAENYYSDSSDDEVLLASRQKPKYPHKYRANCRYGTDSQNRSLKDRNASFERQIDPCTGPSTSIKQFFHQWKLSSRIPPPASRFRLSGASECSIDSEEEVFQAVVGYVGTIEMPRKLPLGSRLQIVRGCIKKLRTEKRTHTAVLMKIMTRSLRLVNGAGITLAVYPGERVTFCGSAQDKDHRHFGVVTTATGEDPSSSCHVFAVDARPHSNHSKRAKIFKLECHVDPVSGRCKEFPVDCEPIVSVIRGFYESQDLPLPADSPQPSHDSTTTTSNSDSGIGYRDDCAGMQSDRILVVDIQNQRLHIQETNERGGEKLTVRTLANALPGRSPSALSIGSESQVYLEDMSVSSGNTKSPDVTVVSTRRNFSQYSLRSVDDMSLGSARSNDGLSQSYKCSPKVYGIPVPTSQSLEDLKDAELSDMVAGGNPHWGSLQDLRSFALDPFIPPDDIVNHDPENDVSAWAASFEKLLEDRTGLCKFAEFLKKEFSHENIYFWVSCEKYRQTDDLLIRRRLAREIYDRHMAMGALEPVNVDSRARQVTQEQLTDAEPDLFLQAQKQIFNLMKFDSYPRFIKSDLYKECVVKVLSGEPVDVDDNSELSLDLTRPVSPMHSKLKKSRSDAEERRRKSLLPWNRKSRAKSRDRARERDTGNDIQDNLDTTSVSSSRSSLTAWDVTHSATMCRVLLPDDSTAVLHTRPDHTVQNVIARLLDKRALAYTDFQVYFNYNNRPIDIREDSMVLSGREIRVERRVSFKLDLPNQKTVVVKSKPTKTLGDVVDPILRKYGYRPENIGVCLTSENQVLDLDVGVCCVDDRHIRVLTRDPPPDPPHDVKEEWRPPPIVRPAKGKSLDEITNSVFEELLHDKAEVQSDQGSVRSEDWASENSSGILGRFLRRDSAFIDKQRKIKKGKSGDDAERKSTLGKLPPLIAKLKPKTEARSESDVLYEGLKRAQRCRLEDQRGTEINFELPDFLKDKENTPQGGKKLRTRQDILAEDADNTKTFGASTANCGEPTSDSKKQAVEDTAVRLPDSPPPLPPKPKNLSTSWNLPPTEPKTLNSTWNQSTSDPKNLNTTWNPPIVETKGASWNPPSTEPKTLGAVWNPPTTEPKNLNSTWNPPPTEPKPLPRTTLHTHIYLDQPSSSFV